jgi:hypothetical protein
MADQRISQLTKLAQADVAANDVLAIVDIGASTTKKVEAKDLFQAGANLADASSVDLAKLNQASTTKLGTTAMADDAITAAKLASNSSIAYDSVAPTIDNFAGRGYVNSTSKALQVWDGNEFQQVVTPETGIVNAAVTNAKIADGAVTTAKISASGLAAAALATDAVITAKIADGAVVAGKIADGAVTTAKVEASGLGAAAIATDAVTTDKVQDGAITAAKLADDSTTIVQAGVPTGSGDYEGQLWFDTNTSVQYVWNSVAWVRQAALNTLTFTDSTPIDFAVTYPDNYSAVITSTLATQAANTVFVGPASGADAAPTFRTLQAADLPNATSTTKGIIQPGTGLAVNAGVLNHSNTVAAGTYTKVTVDTEGHISQGTTLEASDIPDLDASKITTGGVVTDRIGDGAVTIDKLADYSTSSLGEQFPTATFIGQLHLNPIDRTFFMWDGNVWVPIGISAGQIVLAGTFDASTPSGEGSVASVTPDGLAAGFVVGSGLPASSTVNNRHYLVVSSGGTITTGNAPNVNLTPPDLILSVYNTSSPAWVEIDVSTGGGGTTLATSVSFTPAANLAATNVQTALEEVSNECRDADNITSGTLAVARGGTNITSYTKGDLIVASGATALAKQAVGANGQVLTADSAEATGIKWTTPASGTVTQVTSSTAALTVASGTSTSTPALSIRSATTSVDGIVQLSDSTSTTSSTVAATSTAVKAAYDLANAALPKTGGVITGSLGIGNTGSLVFEGSTNDGNETTITVADPTADRTITFPNVTGNVVTTGDSGTVTSTMIASGTIVNADINASAAIAGTKISPNFGSQNIVTTGTASAASLIPTSSSVPANGVYLGAANQLSFATNSARSMYLDSGGGLFVGQAGTGDAQINIGVGATGNRNAYLDLIGDTTYSDFGLRLIRGNQGANATSTLQHRGTGPFTIYAQEAGAIEFQTGNLSSRFDSSNRLLIGYGISNGNYLLQVNSQIFATSATIATSDGRYKENIATLGGCLDIVKALRPVSFTWKPQEGITRTDDDGNEVLVREGHSFPDGAQVGFIAQEVQEVLANKPWLGSVIKENVRPAITDNKGNELAPEEQFFGIAEGNLIAVLTNALQEATAKIEALEARLTAAGL